MQKKTLMPPALFGQDKSLLLFTLLAFTLAHRAAYG
jgi:hypothetical protein